MSAQAASGQLQMAADFDDLQIGDTMITRGRTITESDLVSFSALTGDWHPQHADAAWAAESHFGERIAHGMMVLSYAVGLVPFDPNRVVALRGLERVVFKRPTRMGDTIRVEVKVAEKKPLDEGHGLVGFKWRILNQDGKVACVLRIDALWRIGGAAGGGATGSREAGAASASADPGEAGAASASADPGAAGGASGSAGEASAGAADKGGEGSGPSMVTAAAEDDLAFSLSPENSTGTRAVFL